MTELYRKVLKDKFKFSDFRDKQLEIIKNIIEKDRDVCATMFTGAGKSLCYQFPAVYLNKTSLVISPLISLMNDQKMKMDELNIPTVCLNGTVSDKHEIQKQIMKNKYRVVYTTPEYIVEQKNFLKTIADLEILCLICVDESHCLSHWGSDFRPSYRALSQLKTWLPDVPMMSLTATATENVQSDIIKTLNLNNPAIIRTTFDRPNLNIIVKVKDDILDDLVDLLKDNETSIVYCQTRKETEKIAKLLAKKKIKVGVYHAGMSTSDREEIHNKFVEDEIDVVIATVAFGMGIDKVVRRVVHYGAPKDMESYYQEIGRAGRDGKLATCYLFYSRKDAGVNNYLINQIANSTYRNHMLSLADRMKKYLYTTGCRRKYILEYFGEKYTKDNCNNCDNCKKGNKLIEMRDFTKDAFIFLAAIHETGNTYGMTMIVSIIRGANSKKIPDKYKKIKSYGMGKHHGDDWWKILSRMLVNDGYISEQSYQGGFSFTLALTDKAVAWLKDKNRKMILNVPDEMKQLSPKKISITPVISTVDTTYNMFQKEGMSVADISKNRNISEATVESHLIESYHDGKKLDLDRIGFTESVYNTIKPILEEDINKKIRFVKMKLPKNISYLHINLAKIRMADEDHYSIAEDDDSNDSNDASYDDNNHDDENHMEIIGKLINNSKKDIIEHELTEDVYNVVVNKYSVL